MLDSKYIKYSFLLLLTPILLRFESIATLINGVNIWSNPLFLALYLWLAMVVLVFYFEKENSYIFLGSLFIILFFSYDGFGFHNLLQDYYDTDVYDFQEPVWIDLLNNKSNSIWNQRIGGGHRLVGQIPREYLVFKIIASELFIIFNKYNLYVLFHYITSGVVLLFISQKLNFNKYVGALFAYSLLSSELLSSWYSFIHWPGFVLGLSLILYGIMFKDYRNLVLITLGSYCLATSAHLQLYLMVYIFLGIYYLVELSLNREVREFFQKGSYLVTASLVNFVYLFYFFETMYISDRRSASDFVQIPKINSASMNTLYDPFAIESYFRLNNNLYITPLFLFIFFSFFIKEKKIKTLLFSSLITAYLFSEMNAFAGYFQEIIFIKYVSNWERYTNILIFAVSILIFSGINKFYEEEYINKKTFLVVLFSISLISSVERQNILPNLELTFLDVVNQDMVYLTNLTDDSYRVAGVCFEQGTDHQNIDKWNYAYRPNGGLTYNSSSRWFDIYDSWVSKGYSEYFKYTTAGIGSGIPYGGGWFHSTKGSIFNLRLAAEANVKYIISPKAQNCFSPFDVNLIKTTDTLDLFEIQNPKQRYFFTTDIFDATEYTIYNIYYLIEKGFHSVNSVANIDYDFFTKLSKLDAPEKPSKYISLNFNTDGSNIILVDGKRYSLFQKDGIFTSGGSEDEFNNLLDNGYSPISNRDPIFINYTEVNNKIFGVYSNPRYKTTLKKEIEYPDIPIPAFPQLSNTSNSTPEIIKEDLRNGYFKVDLTTSEPTFLIFNETWDPGWKLTVNGVEKDILIANRAFMGLLIEEGTHSVEFVYENFSFERVFKAFRLFTN